MENQLKNRWSTRSNKRILCLDGGGIRGALTLGFLEKIEKILRDQHEDETLLLCDYFDLIIGTSTGSIIAAGLATGMSVSEITEKYLALGGNIFNKKRKPWLKDFGIGLRYFLAADYDEAPLEEELKNTFKKSDGTYYSLGDPGIRTGLCLVTKRADTFSTWLLHNNPDSRFYPVNKDIPLWKIVRASSAAPTFFKPVKIVDGDNNTGVYIDGGVSSANNPALMAFFMTTVRGFNYNWTVGPDKLMIVSVGTGFKIHREKSLDDVVNRRGIQWGNYAIDMFMSDANYMNQMILQAMSDSSTANIIDSEIGDLSDDIIYGQGLFHYNRYNMPMEKQSLAELGYDFDEARITELIRMDNGANAALLYELGQKKSAEMVKPEHFNPEFKVSS